MEIHLYVHLEDQTSLRRIERKIDKLVREVDSMTPELEAVQVEVQDNSDAIDSAVTLLGSLSQLIKDNAEDPAALRQIAADLDANSKRLADAVVANTPATPAPPGPPAPTPAP